MPRKMLVLIAVSLGISSFFVAKVPLNEEMAFISSLFIIIFALPSYRAIVGLCGRRYGLLVLLSLGAYALVIESLALAYGFPYGSFTYTDILGNKLFGLTPWTVAFAYPPILLLAYVIARKQSENRFAVLLLTALLATAIDTVLDPAAVRLGFWYWDTPGFYYGVPLINFIGWLGSSFVGGSILYALLNKSERPAAQFAWSGMAILYFWTCVNGWLGQVIPVTVGIALLGYFMSQLGYDRKIRHYISRRRPGRPHAPEAP